MIIIAVTLLSSDWGMDASGAVVSVDVAEGVLEGALLDQRKPHIHLGHCHHSKSVFLGFRLSFCTVFHLVLTITVVTDVPVSAGGRNATSCIPSLTHQDVVISGDFLAFSIIGL